MLPIQKLEIRASEIRSRLAELGGMEELDETHRAEIDTLRKEYDANEAQQRALKLAGGGPPEGVETRTEDTPDDRLEELRKEVQFGNYVAAALAGRPVLTGAEAEYNAELGIKEDYFPLSLIARSAPERLETRAARDGEAQTNQGSWIDRVFYGSAAERVGISFRSVSPGVAAYPVTTAGGSGVQRGRTEAVTESTYTFAVTEIKPSRHAVHGIYSIEDDMRLPGMADAIERDMRMGIMESVDKAVFLGDNGANENTADVTGLNTASIGEGEITQANKVKGPETLQAFLAYVDGQYAGGMGDLRVVSTVGANTLWRGTITNEAASNQTIGAFLMENGLTWGVRGGIETATAAGDFAAFIGLGRGIEGAGIAAVWESAQLIRDPYTNATSGEVKLTLNYLWQMAFPRTANFKRLKYVA